MSLIGLQLTTVTAGWEVQEARIPNTPITDKAIMLHRFPVASLCNFTLSSKTVTANSIQFSFVGISLHRNIQSLVSSYRVQSSLCHGVQRATGAWCPGLPSPPGAPALPIVGSHCPVAAWESRVALAPGHGMPGKCGLLVF